MALPEFHITDIWKPSSTPADLIFHAATLTVVICGLIFLFVGGLIVYGIVRYRQRAGDELLEPPQVYGSDQIELAWTVVPVLIVFVLLMVSARVIASVQNAVSPPNAVHATVIGHQWWWEIRYPQLGIVTANEFHIPVSAAEARQPTFLNLQAADVIHSFWVPQLAGKTDTIPNRINTMWLEPRTTGVFLGNCAEFCGLQHANMLIRVVVHSKDDFEKWAAAQRLASAQQPGAQQGRAVFESISCVNCHTIRGTLARGMFGPDLTHLMSRSFLGSGVLSNTAPNLRKWVDDPQTIKPGCLMPSMKLNPNELDQVVSYLVTLN